MRLERHCVPRGQKREAGSGAEAPAPSPSPYLAPVHHSPNQETNNQVLEICLCMYILLPSLTTSLPLTTAVLCGPGPYHGVSPLWAFQQPSPLSTPSLGNTHSYSLLRCPNSGSTWDIPAHHKPTVEPPDHLSSTHQSRRPCALHSAALSPWHRSGLADCR